MTGRLSGRYELKRAIGRGAHGVVYEARDMNRGTKVALKTLRDVGPAHEYGLKREFRACAGVVHPNLVSLYDLVGGEDGLFFTMEYVDGMPFMSWVRGERWTPNTASQTSNTLDPERFTQEMGTDTIRHASVAVPMSWTPDSGEDRHRSQGTLGRGDPPPDLGRVRDAFSQLAHGVAALHAANRLHRDLKPGNVLVTSTGRVVIVDFGLAAVLRDGTTTPGDGVAGTASYMSPEQSFSDGLGPETDWYAFGVMLYECLTGVRPYSGTVARILADKQSIDPPLAAQLCPGLPPDLAALANALMARNPNDRPKESEILAVLGSEAGEGPTPDVQLVGRSRSLRRMHRAWERVGRHGTVVLDICGGSGMGKTVLVEHFLKEVPATALTGGCHVREMVPYNAFDEVVDSLATLLSTEQRWMVPEEVEALCRVFPSLRRVPVLDVDVRPADGDVLELRTLAFKALAELLRQLEPLVLHLDDLQWADDDSFLLLESLVALRPPLLLILTYRPVEDGLRERLKRVLGDVRRVHMDLGPLSPRESVEFALRRLPPRASPAKAEAIAVESAGNPLFIEELARRSEDQPVIDLDAALAQRVRELPEQQQLLVELLAVAGRPIGQKELADAAGVDPLLPLMDALAAVNLVRSSREKVGIFHARISEAVLARMDDRVRSETHERLAVTLERGHAEPEALMKHWQGAGRVERAAGYAVQAAEQAMATLAFESAASHYRTALELGEWQSEQRWELSVLLGEALYLGGRLAEAGHVWVAALEGRGRNRDMELRAAEALLMGGDLNQGLGYADQVLNTVRMRASRSRMNTVASLLWLRFRLWWRGLDLGEKATANERWEVNLYRSMVRGFSLVDPAQSEAFLHRHLIAALDAGDRKESLLGLCGLAISSASGAARRRAQVPELLGRIEDLNPGDSESLAMVALCRGSVAFSEGRFSDTVRWSDRALELINNDCRGMAFERTSANLFACWGLLFRGDVAALSRRLPGLLRDAERRGDDRFRATAETELYSVVALARDQPDIAEVAIERCVARIGMRDQFRFPEQSEMLARAQVSHYRGEPVRAWEQLEHAWPRLMQSLMMHHRFIRLEAWLLRGRTALAAYRITGRQDLLRVGKQALDRAHADPAPWSEALRSHTLATLARLTGKHAEAQSRLRAATEHFGAADMQLHAHASMRQLGMSVGGTEGRTLQGTADAWFLKQGVVDPDAMGRMVLADVTPLSR